MKTTKNLPLDFEVDKLTNSIENWTRRSKNHPTPGIIEPLLPDINI